MCTNIGLLTSQVDRKRTPSIFLKKDQEYTLNKFHSTQEFNTAEKLYNIAKPSGSLFLLACSPLKSDSFSSLNSPFTTAVPSQCGAGLETVQRKIWVPLIIKKITYSEVLLSFHVAQC